MLYEHKGETQRDGLHIRLKPKNSRAFFHDNRAEAQVMAKALNLAIDKINELVREVRDLKACLNERGYTVEK